MKVLVTGGAGFIGSNLVDKLIELGHDVTVIDNESAESNDTFYWNTKAKNYKLDVCDYEAIEPLFRNIDYVFHLAAASRIQLSIEDPTFSVKTNVLGTASVLQASAKNKVKRLVYSSTSSAYGNNGVPNVETQPSDCLTPYSVSKVAAENLCTTYSKLFNLETITLRYFNAYGNRQPLRGQYAPLIGLFEVQKNNGLPLTIVGDGIQRRDFTNVDDIVQANILAATAELSPELLGTVFNIGSSKNYSINEIAKMFNWSTINIKSRPGEALETLANIEKAKKYLKWYPKIDIEQWLKEKD